MIVSEERRFDRELQPLGFWFTIFATVLAGAMGAIFAGIGIFRILGF